MIGDWGLVIGDWDRGSGSGIGDRGLGIDRMPFSRRRHVGEMQKQPADGNLRGAELEIELGTADWGFDRMPFSRRRHVGEMRIAD